MGRRLPRNRFAHLRLVLQAIALQERLAGHDLIKLRIGVHLGDIVHEDEDINGDCVNIAARLQETTEPECVLVSSVVHDNLFGRSEARFTDLGELRLKNLTRPIRAWRWGEPLLEPGRKVVERYQ